MDIGARPGRRRSIVLTAPRAQPAFHIGRPAAIAKENSMLRYAVIFFVIALIAAVLGFTGIAGTASSIAWILFVVFLVLAVISLIRGRRPVA